MRNIGFGMLLHLTQHCPHSPHLTMDQCLLIPLRPAGWVLSLRLLREMTRLHQESTGCSHWLAPVTVLQQYHSPCSSDMLDTDSVRTRTQSRVIPWLPVFRQLCVESFSCQIQQVILLWHIDPHLARVFQHILKTVRDDIAKLSKKFCCNCHNIHYTFSLLAFFLWKLGCLYTKLEPIWDLLSQDS